MKCGKCAQPAEVGKRCVRCYVLQQAHNAGLTKVQWWIKDRDRFAELMYYRWLALANGAEPDFDTVMAAFSNHGKNSGQYERQRVKIRAIVATFDKMVRRQNERAEEGPGADTGSEAGG